MVKVKTVVTVSSIRGSILLSDKLIFVVWSLHILDHRSLNETAHSTGSGTQPNRCSCAREGVEVGGMLLLVAKGEWGAV